MEQHHMTRRGTPLITLRALFPITALRVISGSVRPTSQWFLNGTSLCHAVFGKQVQQCGTIMCNWLRFAGNHREADGFKACFSPSWDTFICALSIWLGFLVKSPWIAEPGILTLFYSVCFFSGLLTFTVELSWWWLCSSQARPEPDNRKVVLFLQLFLF